MLPDEGKAMILAVPLAVLGSLIVVVLAVLIDKAVAWVS